MGNDMSDASFPRCPFADWTVVSKIGQGGYGQVYLIERTTGHTTIQSAMKVIRLSAAGQDSARLMSNDGMGREAMSARYAQTSADLEKEIEVMAQLRHIGHIVSYEDHQVERHADGVGATIYIRMEYLTPLHDWLKDRSITGEDVVSLAEQVCAALYACADMGIVHRDIKPENIFVGADGTFKLGDFGIAMRLDSLTRQDRLKQGSPNYISPEVWRSERADARSDIYSLGMVMYRLLNEGRVPFLTDQDETAARERRLRGEPLPQPSQCPAALWPVIQKATSFDADGRYASAADMRNALLALHMHSSAQLDAPVACMRIAASSGDKTSSRSHHTGPTGEKSRKFPKEGTNTDTTTGNPPPPPEPTPTPQEEKKSHRGIWLIAGIVAALCIAATLLLVLKPWRDGMNLVARRQGSDVILTLTGGTGPYKLTAQSARHVVLQDGFGTDSITLDSLSPDVAYVLTVTDSTGATAKASIEGHPVAPYTGSGIRKIAMGVYRCDRADMIRHGWFWIDEHNGVGKPVSVIELRDGSVDSQTDKWTLLISTTVSDPADQMVDAQLKLELSDGVAYTQQLGITLGAAVNQNPVDLDGVLTQVHDAYNGWPSLQGRLQLYIDNQLAQETSITLSPDDWTTEH